MSCCKFPKKYLCFAKNEEGEVVQFFVNEEINLRLKELAKQYPDAALRLIK
jgi:hypothetical protein